jgi:hypothetical protein
MNIQRACSRQQQKFFPSGIFNKKCKTPNNVFKGHKGVVAYMNEFIMKYSFMNLYRLLKK